MNEFEKRILELSSRADSRGFYTFTDFLNPTEQSALLNMRLPVPVTLYGGAEQCERRMARFGDFGFVQDFPLTVVKITTTGKKFATRLTHRDYLGAMLNLGIDRSKVGDIFTDGAEAYVALHEALAPFITQNLNKVGGNSVEAVTVEAVPKGFLPKTEEVRLPVASVRLDAVVCKIYNLSRESGAELVRRGLVSVNGRTTESGGYALKEGEVIAVRGYGKFKFVSECGASAKGKPYVLIEKYV